MADQIGKVRFSRREFMTVAGVGATTSLLLGACSLGGPAGSDEGPAADSVESVQQEISALPSYVTQRAAGLRQLDSGATLRNSAHTPDVIAAYHDYLGSPLSALAEKLLHTSYTAR